MSDTPLPPPTPSAPSSRAQIKARALADVLRDDFDGLVAEMHTLLPHLTQDAVEMAVLRGIVQPTLIDTFEATRGVGREVLGAILTETQIRVIRRAYTALQVAEEGLTP